MSAARVAENLSALIQCRTVSADPDPREFARLREVLDQLYPATHAALVRDVLPDGSLLLTWRGRNSLRPLLLMAHHDVVPAPTPGWSVDPFGGIVTEIGVHGRGALDDKGPLVCVMEAVEQLVAQGFTPEHDVLIFSGADEETAGRGAQMAADLLRSRDVTPWLVSDEGGAIVEAGMLPGTTTPIAAVAVAEKGTVDVRIAAVGVGGHSSMPQPRGTTERLAEAILRICRYQPQQTIPDAVRCMLEDRRAGLSPELASALDGPPARLAELLAMHGEEIAAMTRTTMAVTRLQGSPGDNVLATRAEANVNVRLTPGDTIELLVDRLSTLLADLEIEIAPPVGDNPSPTASCDGPQWALVKEAVAAIDPTLAVVPYLQSGSTDSRYFARSCPATYRFAPLVMNSEQRRAIHGIDEYVTHEALDGGIAFHRRLIERHREI